MRSDVVAVPENTPLARVDLAGVRARVEALAQVEAMTSNILLINNGRILAEGNIHQIRERLAVVPQITRADLDPSRRPMMRMSLLSPAVHDRFGAAPTVVTVPQRGTNGEGAIDEITSPDDNLQAVFTYLVKS